uniref:4'-phosphopantetheinyl transferase domain-containing protein n=1 Tax=Arcella intermedia TaxID=1963864 RepID=A0A6B2LQ35_9EUKA
MMLHGIGNDIVKISRIDSTYRRFGDKFARRILNPKEMTLLEKRKGDRQIQFLAGRWCAKEAAFKAFSKARIEFPEIVLLEDERGAPKLHFEGKAAELASSLGITATHVSISHETEYVIANVILEKNPTHKA